MRFRRLFDQRLVVLIISLIVSLPTHSEVSRVASPSYRAQHGRRCSHVVAKDRRRTETERGQYLRLRLINAGALRPTLGRDAGLRQFALQRYSLGS